LPEVLVFQGLPSQLRRRDCAHFAAFQQDDVPLVFPSLLATPGPKRQFFTQTTVDAARDRRATKRVIYYNELVGLSPWPFEFDMGYNAHRALLARFCTASG
jgi:hypothetical protein